MPATALSRGRLAELLRIDEATFGTDPGGNYRRQPIYGVNLNPSKTLQADGLLSAGLNNTLDPANPAPSIERGQGSVDVPVCLNNIGYWLRDLFGDPTTTGSSDYDHVFASGAEALPSSVIEVKRAVSSYQKHLGVTGSGFSLSFDKGDGYRRMTFNYSFRNAPASTTSSGGGTPVAAETLNQLPAALSKILIDGVEAGYIAGGNMTYSNGLGPLDFLDDVAFTSGFEIGQDEASLTGSLNVRVKDDALIGLSDGGTTPHLMSIVMEQSATRSITFALSRVRFEKTGVPITGPGGISATLNFRAEQTAVADMLTVTLKNGIAAYS